MAAVRKRWTPSRTALATLCRAPNVTNAPASTQAAWGSAPAIAATTRALPPASAVSACTRQAHATIASASCVRPAPTASATDRISASAMPLVSTSSTEIAMNEMKLWRPNSDGLRKRAAAIDIANTYSWGTTWLVAVQSPPRTTVAPVVRAAASDALMAAAASPSRSSSAPGAGAGRVRATAPAPRGPGA